MIKKENLVAMDFIAAFNDRQVQPLQRQPHRICNMSGQFDPCWLSTSELSSTRVVRHVNNITTAKLAPATWYFGKEPYI